MLSIARERWGQGEVGPGRGGSGEKWDRGEVGLVRSGTSERWMGETEMLRFFVEDRTNWVVE